MGHHDCGMGGLKADDMIRTMKKEEFLKKRSIPLSTLEYDVQDWSKGFSNVDSVLHVVWMLLSITHFYLK